MNGSAMVEIQIIQVGEETVRLKQPISVWPRSSIVLREHGLGDIQFRIESIEGETATCTVVEGLDLLAKLKAKAA